MPLDAVKEYQVLFSPFDVRHGGFAGAGINVVTRSGTNDLHGSAFALGTNERLGPNVPLIRNARYEKQQFGFSLGGPIVRDRLHFFIASEVQNRVIPGPRAVRRRRCQTSAMFPCQHGGCRALSKVLARAWARWRIGGSSEQCQSVVERIPSSRRADITLE